MRIVTDFGDQTITIKWTPFFFTSWHIVVIAKESSNKIITIIHSYVNEIGEANYYYSHSDGYVQ